MNQAIDEKTFLEIERNVYYVSNKAMMANFHIEKLNEILKNDERIVYEYMKQANTFLDTVEHGIKHPDQDIHSDVMKDLSYYSGGNSELLDEYSKNKEFIQHLTRGHELRYEVGRDAIALEQTFEDHRFPSEQRGVAVIIYKAEHDKYDVFMQPNRFRKELQQELSGLVRHEPYQKSREEIEQDRKALAELKERQETNRALREERIKKRDYDRYVKEYHERSTANEAKEKTSQRESGVSEKGVEVIDFKEFDNRTEFIKKMHQEEGFVEAIGDSVIELQLHLEQYHERFRKGNLERADWNIQEIKFHLSGLGHDVESSGFKEIELKLRSGSYPNDKQEFYSNFLNDTKQVRLTRDHAQLIQEKEETEPKRTHVGLEL